MNMNERRFALGLAAGMLFGVAVIAASGGLGAFATPLSQEFAGKAVTTTSSSTYSSTALLTTASTSTSATPAGANSTLYTVSANSSSSTSTVSTTGHYGLTGLVSTVTLPSASFAAILSQDPQSNAFLVIPLAIALLFGAAVYRKSARRKADSQGPEQAE